MKSTLFVALLALAAIAPPAAADETAPAALAASCTACHGPGGHSAGAIPSLAGLDSTTLTALLLAMRSGEQPTTVMGRILKGYTDPEINALALEVARLKN